MTAGCTASADTDRVAVGVRGVAAVGSRPGPLDRERSDLVATVAHELRSPLTGSRVFVPTLLAKWDKLIDEQKKLMLETVNSNSQPACRLRVIVELLDVARIDTGRLALHPRPVDVVETLEQVLASVSAPAPGARSSFGRPRPTCRRRNRDPDKPVQVVTDLIEKTQSGHDEGGSSPHEPTAPMQDRTRSPGCCCASTTRATGSARRSGAGCSPSSGRAGSAAARGWACTSCTAWSTPTSGTVEMEDAPDGGARGGVDGDAHARRTPPQSEAAPTPRLKPVRRRPRAGS